MGVFVKLTERKIRRSIIGAVLALGLFFDLLFMSRDVLDTGKSIWLSAGLWVENFNYVSVICLALIFLFVINLAMAVVEIVLAFRGDKLSYWPFLIGGCARVAMMVLSNASDALAGRTFLMVIGIVLSAAGAVFSAWYTTVSSNKESREGDEKSLFAGRKWILSMIGFVSVALVISLFFVPFCSYVFDSGEQLLIPISAFSAGEDIWVALILFVALAIFSVFTFSGVLKCLRSLREEEHLFSDRVGNVVRLGAIATGIYFVASVAYCSVQNSTGKAYTTASYVPFLMMVVVCVVFAFFARSLGQEVERNRAEKAARIELFVYGLLISIITAVASLSDIIKVTFIVPSFLEDIYLNGFDIFMSYNSMDSGFQLVAFFLFSILSVMVVLLLSSVISLISKSKLFYKITLAEIVCGAAFSLMIGLFGKYYEIVQKLNEDTIRSLILRMGVSSTIDFVYHVTGQSFYWFIGAMIIVVVTLIRKPYSRGVMGDEAIAIMACNSDRFGQEEKEPPCNTEETVARKQAQDVDPCPAFTDIDGKVTEFQAKAEARREASFEAPTLQTLVRFVVEYARDSRLHLSYSVEDIATFVAGLGSTRLSILQGMSGTGKTSLPKIFSEAIMGNCDIVEVESSWRDKNELLGYYNEFSRCYTPKKFTQALYKAKLNPEVMTFIVLDEMNLSRIEYYFSDFLSLMENEEDKREIKLLNVSLKRIEGGKTYHYLGLSEGHTLKIPNNIWFIGTANRDESTFEISDKVYDRAHTMNFNKRAPKVLSYGTLQACRYLSVEAFIELLENAKKTRNFDIDSCSVIREVEGLLAPYNISFGNRIAKQIESFVSIYCACFPAPDSVVDDAVERIILSKVVSKLEFKSVENKVQLAAEFEKRKLHKCSEFILKLNED